MSRVLGTAHSFFVAASAVMLALAIATSCSVALADPPPLLPPNCPVCVGCAAWTKENGCGLSTCNGGGANCLGCICTENQMACKCQSG